VKKIKKSVNFCKVTSKKIKCLVHFVHVWSPFLLKNEEFARHLVYGEKQVSLNAVALILTGLDNCQTGVGQFKIAN